MAIDSVGSPIGPVGLTVPPPQEEVPPADDRDYVEPQVPYEAPLPSYQGTAVDESV